MTFCSFVTVAVLAMCGSLLTAQVQAISKPTDSSYVAAVVEFRYTENGPTPADQLTDRINQYVSLMDNAHGQNVDIIVFPEATLTADEQAQDVPDAIDRIVPCNNASYPNTGPVARISCAARAANLYAVINLTMRRKCDAKVNGAPCSNQTVNSLYNTNVVFDRNGTVISV